MFLRNILGSVSLLILSGISNLAQAQDPNVVICDTCTTNARYAQAATSSFADIVPLGILQGTKGVFVVNLNNNQDYYFEVTRSYDSPGSEVQIGDFFSTSARNVAAPAGQQQDINDSIFIFREVLDIFSVSSVQAGELGNLGFDSALDLVGDFRNQRTLQNALSNRFEGLWASIAVGIINDNVQRLINRYIGENDLISGNSIDVIFGDESTVRVRVTNISRAVDNQDEILIDYEVTEDSISINGRRAAPFNAGELDGFSFGTNNPLLMNNLTDLANRFPGVDFTGGISNTGSIGGGGSQGCYLLSCAEIDGETTCTLTSVALCP